MSAATLPALFSLAGKRGLILGITNEHSIATGCARAFAGCGAMLAATYRDEKARPHVVAVVETLPAAFLLPCAVHEPGALEAVFAEVALRWGRLDFLLHSITFVPAAGLRGRVVDSSPEGFALAMDISCHSFLRAARLAEPLMPQGGALLAVTSQGSGHVVPHYNLMGPVKAALESAVRYAAAELGPRGIRVNAISLGPIATRAASGIEDYGGLAAFLVGDAARMLTGTLIHVDGGQHLLA